MNITILGCGRWGTFLAYYLQEINHNVLLWGRSSSEKMEQLFIDRKNDYLTLPKNVILSTSLKEALSFSQYVVVAINPHNILNLIGLILAENYQDKIFILAMKGFDKTGERISTVLTKNLSDKIKIVSLIGAGQPQDLMNRIPTCMLVDSNDNFAKREVAQIFESDLISIYMGNDLTGSEIGAAAKNVLGIGAGILDALGFRPLIGSLVVFGLNELAKLVCNSGGNKDTVYGLSCLGDIEATFFSPHSRSRNAGFSIVNSTKTDDFVPGFYTSETILKMAKNHNSVMPLFEAINQIIKRETEPQSLIKCLMHYNRSKANCPSSIKNIYYSRAMDGFKFEELIEIYNNVDKLLEEKKLVLSNNSQELFKDSTEIISNNMRLLEQSDCAIIDLSIKNHLYVGCIDEMVCANQKNIVVIVICGNSGVEKHLYTKYRANKIVMDMDEAIEYINLLNESN